MPISRATAWGGLVAPPALLMGAADAAAVGDRPVKPPTASIAVRVPLPGTAIINASNDVEFSSPIVEGDRLSVIEEVVVGVAGEDHTAGRRAFHRDTRDLFAAATAPSVAISTEHRSFRLHACDDVDEVG